LWKNHGSQTGGYYVCTKYSEEQATGKQSAEEDVMVNNTMLLQKYSFYYKRYKGSGDAIVFTQNLSKKLEEAFKDSELHSVEFLTTAIEQLLAARRALMWTYPLAYYLRSGERKRLFEYQQQLLLNATEFLQDIMESFQSLALLAKREEVVNRTSSMAKFRQELVKLVEEGLLEEDLLANADIATDMWACSTCTVENSRTETHCTSCLACKKHGEMECRSCKVDQPVQPPQRGIRGIVPQRATPHGHLLGTLWGRPRRETR
jgi:hypothetical protein